MLKYQILLGPYIGPITYVMKVLIVIKILNKFKIVPINA